MKKKDTEVKSSYSLRELVVEITGVSPLMDSFNAEYKAVQRIVQVMKMITGNKEKLTVQHDEKAAFVAITKKLYEMILKEESNEYQELFNRMKINEQLSEQELTMLIEWFKEALELSNSEIHKLALEKVTVDEKFYSLRDEVEKLIINDVHQITKIMDTSRREMRIKEYLTILKKEIRLENWRNEVKNELANDFIMRKMIEVSKDSKFDVKEVLEGKDPVLLQEVMSEIINRDIKRLINKGDNNKETDSK